MIRYYTRRNEVKISFHLQAFDIQLAPPDYFHLRLFTFGTAEIEIFRDKIRVTIPAVKTGGSACKRKAGVCGDGIFAEEAEVKINRLFDHAGELANDQINPDYLTGFSFLRVFKRQGQEGFDNALFMHYFYAG